MNISYEHFLEYFHAKTFALLEIESDRILYALPHKLKGKESHQFIYVGGLFW